MKPIVVATVLLLCFNIQASTLNFSSMVGDYKLATISNGVCAPILHVVEENFSNQRTTHSLSLYGENGAPETDLIYQLTGLNTGVDFHITTNPMFGNIDGSVYELETLNNNVITADTTVKNDYGVVLWKTTLNAEFKAESLKFLKTDYNILSGNIVFKSSKCEYLKK